MGYGPAPPRNAAFRGNNRGVYPPRVFMLCVVLTGFALLGEKESPRAALRMAALGKYQSRIIGNGKGGGKRRMTSSRWVQELLRGGSSPLTHSAADMPGFLGNTSSHATSAYLAAGDVEAQKVLEALSVLYSPRSSEDARGQADRYLSAWQTSDAVWEISERILHQFSGLPPESAGESANAAFFAAKALYEKICNDFHRLPAGLLPRLRASMFESLVKIATARSIAAGRGGGAILPSSADPAAQKLMTGLIALAMHAGWNDLVPEILERAKSRMLPPAASLAFLTLVAEEAAAPPSGVEALSHNNVEDFREFGIHANCRSVLVYIADEITYSMQQQSLRNDSRVGGSLGQHHYNGEEEEEVGFQAGLFKCFGAWISWSEHGDEVISAAQISHHPILMLAPAAVGVSGSKAKQARSEAAREMIETVLDHYSTSGDRPVLEVLLTSAAAQRQRLMVLASEEAALQRANSDGSCGGEQAFQMHNEAEEIVRMLTHALSLQSERRRELRRFRYEAIDDGLRESALRVLGPELLLRILLQELERAGGDRGPAVADGSGDWRHTEATLFALRSLIRELTQDIVNDARRRKSREQQMQQQQQGVLLEGREGHGEDGEENASPVSPSSSSSSSSSSIQNRKSMLMRLFRGVCGGGLCRETSNLHVLTTATALCGAAAPYLRVANDDEKEGPLLLREAFSWVMRIFFSFFQQPQEEHGLPFSSAALGKSKEETERRQIPLFRATASAFLDLCEAAPSEVSPDLFAQISELLIRARHGGQSRSHHQHHPHQQQQQQQQQQQGHDVSPPPGVVFMDLAQELDILEGLVAVARFNSGDRDRGGLGRGSGGEGGAEFSEISLLLDPILAELHRKAQKIELGADVASPPPPNAPAATVHDNKQQAGGSSVDIMPDLTRLNVIFRALAPQRTTAAKNAQRTMHQSRIDAWALLMKAWPILGLQGVLRAIDSSVDAAEEWCSIVKYAARNVRGRFAVLMEGAGGGGGVLRFLTEAYSRKHYPSWLYLLSVLVVELASADHESQRQLFSSVTEVAQEFFTRYPSLEAMNEARDNVEDFFRLQIRTTLQASVVAVRVNERNAQKAVLVFWSDFVGLALPPRIRKDGKAAVHPLGEGGAELCEEAVIRSLLMPMKTNSENAPELQQHQQQQQQPVGFLIAKACVEALTGLFLSDLHHLDEGDRGSPSYVIWSLLTLESNAIRRRQKGGGGSGVRHSTATLVIARTAFFA
eukprot:jgi/Bigna1/139261/aug1.49_g13969